MKRSIPIIAFVMVLSLVLLIGCATPMPKTEYRDNWARIDYYALIRKLPEKDRWDTCFEMAEVEKESEITISSSEDWKFRDKLDPCIVARFLVKHRYKFIDKSPEYSNVCNEIGVMISLLKELSI
jgi:hypothetical protein